MKTALVLLPFLLAPIIAVQGKLFSNTSLASKNTLTVTSVFMAFFFLFFSANKL